MLSNCVRSQVYHELDRSSMKITLVLFSERILLHMCYVIVLPTSDTRKNPPAIPKYVVIICQTAHCSPICNLVTFISPLFRPISVVIVLLSNICPPIQSSAFEFSWHSTFLPVKVTSEELAKDINYNINKESPPNLFSKRSLLLKAVLGLARLKERVHLLSKWSNFGVGNLMKTAYNVCQTPLRKSLPAR